MGNLLARRVGWSFEVTDSGRSSEALMHQTSSITSTAGQAVVQGAHNVTIHGGTFNLYSSQSHPHRSDPHESIGEIKEICCFLSANNYLAIHADIYEKRTPGTGSWFLESLLFQAWLSGNCRIIWGTGMPGSGKTVLVSTIINFLQESTRSYPDVAVAFVYCRYTDPFSVRDILAGLVRQMLQRYTFLVHLVKPVYDQHRLEGTRPSQADLIKLLHKISASFAVCYYVLDGLDEALPDTQFDLLQTLSSVQGNFIVTSRPLITLQSAVPNVTFFDIVAQDQDIDLLILQKIDNTPTFRSLLDRHNARERVLSTIRHQSQGMFLHASLQVDMVRNCTTLAAVFEKLSGLPSKLEELYAFTVQRIQALPGDQADLAKRVLLWVLYASRTLFIEELRFAVANRWNEESLADEAVLVSVCCGLITVEPSSRKVRLIHFTAKDTLRSLLANEFPNPHSVLAQVCIKRMEACGIPKFGSNHRKEALNEEQAVYSERPPFLDYAYNFWSVHVRSCLEQPGDSEALDKTLNFLRQCRRFPLMRSSTSNWWDIVDIFTSPLHIVAHFNLARLVGPLIDIAGNVIQARPGSRCTVNDQTPAGKTALHLAAAEGHEEVVEQLLATQGIDVDVLDNKGANAVLVASYHGQAGVLRQLLKLRSIDVNATLETEGWNTDPREVGWTALMRASARGQEDLVRLLLEQPRILVNKVNDRGETALMLAAEYGKEQVIRLLLSFPGIDVNLRGCNQRMTPLMLAASGGHHRVVESLLACPGIDVNASATEDQLSALMMAAEAGEDRVVELLLQFLGIDVNAIDRCCRTAVVIAKMFRWKSIRHEAIVNMLLSFPGVDTTGYYMDIRVWRDLQLLGIRYHTFDPSMPSRLHECYKRAEEGKAFTRYEHPMWSLYEL